MLSTWRALELLILGGKCSDKLSPIFTVQTTRRAKAPPAECCDGRSAGRRQLGDVALDVAGDRLPHPTLSLSVRHPVAPEQHLLVVEWKACDLPADRQPLEEQLRAPAPGVLLAGGGRGRRLADLLDRLRAQRLAQDQHVALVVDVVDGGDLRPRLPRLLFLCHL